MLITAGAAAKATDGALTSARLYVDAAAATLTLTPTQGGFKNLLKDGGVTAGDRVRWEHQHGEGGPPSP